VNEELHIKESNVFPLARGKPFERLEARSPKPGAFRKTLLKMRDGPRSREPVNRLTTGGVPVTLINHFVSLCVYLVYLVTNKIKLVIKYKSHTRQHRAMINLRKNKDFSLVLRGVCPYAGEKFSFLVTVPGDWRKRI